MKKSRKLIPLIGIRVIDYLMDITRNNRNEII